MTADELEEELRRLQVVQANLERDCEGFERSPTDAHDLEEMGARIRTHLMRLATLAALMRLAERDERTA